MNQDDHVGCVFRDVSAGHESDNEVIIVVTHPVSIGLLIMGIRLKKYCYSLQIHLKKKKYFLGNKRSNKNEVLCHLYSLSRW